MTTIGLDGSLQETIQMSLDFWLLKMMTNVHQVNLKYVFIFIYFQDIFDGACEILKLFYKIKVCQHLILNLYTFFLRVLIKAVMKLYSASRFEEHHDIF